MTIAILCYLAYLLIVLVINSAVIYHFTKYCFPGDITKGVVLIYGIVMISVPVITFMLIGIIH